MSATTWESLIDTLAGRQTEPTVEDVSGHMTDRHLAAWLDRELGMLTPEQILSDVANELQRDLDGRVEEANRIGRIVLHALADRTPQTVVWRVLRDAMRRCAVRDACREIDQARSVEEWQSSLKAAIDRFDPDRHAIAAQHNAEAGL